jgi:putative ATP-dependent endonuclease of OLD family
MATSELRLALIEEIEAHLHPQAQLRLIKYLENEIDKKGGQFILTTHSTILASEIVLSHLIICQDDKVFPMSSSHTLLSKENYEFLERFLDATKSNLFFAKGVIFVEGDAENLLFPTIAELIDCPLHKHGVSIVKVGSKAFFSYANIFKRQKEPKMTIPVAVVTDMDVPPFEYKSIDKVHTLSETAISQVRGIEPFSQINIAPLVNSLFSSQDALIKNVKKLNPGRLPNGLKEELAKYSRDITSDDIVTLRRQKKLQIAAEFDKDSVKSFISKVWTMEFDIALSGLKKELYQAVLWAKSPESTISEITEEAEADFALWNGKSQDEIAYNIYKPLLNNTVSKATTAQYFVRILKEKCKTPSEKEVIIACINSDENWKYIHDAIKYATKKA